MCENWSYVSSMEEINKLTEELNKAKEDIKIYESDFTILREQETNICSLMATTKNTSENYDRLKNACTKIEDFKANGDFVPGIETLLDFSLIQYTSTYIGLNSDFYYDDLETVAKEIDNLKETVAHSIETTNNIIENHPHKINYIKQCVSETYGHSE